MNDISFGQYLVQMRKQKEMSQRKLAQLAGVTNSTISRIESDTVKPDPVTLEKIAAALCIDKATLFFKCGYIDVVPVVRCKDCRYCKKENNNLLCEIHYEHIHEDYFCASGEERECANNG